MRAIGKADASKHYIQNKVASITLTDVVLRGGCVRTWFAATKAKECLSLDLLSRQCRPYSNLHQQTSGV